MVGVVSEWVLVVVMNEVGEIVGKGEFPGVVAEPREE